MRKQLGFYGFDPYGKWQIALLPLHQLEREMRRWEFAFTFNPDRDLLDVMDSVHEEMIRCYGIKPLFECCYLLHFDRAYRHAQHYLGCTVNVRRRIKQHRSPRSKKSSALTRAVAKSKIGMRVVRLWQGDWDTEIELKRQGNSIVHCAYCNERRLEQQRQYRIRKRQQQPQAA
jgi:hypothetical protein